MSENTSRAAARIASRLAALVRSRLPAVAAPVTSPSARTRRCPPPGPPGGGPPGGGGGGPPGGYERRAHAALRPRHEHRRDAAVQVRAFRHAGTVPVSHGARATR